MLLVDYLIELNSLIRLYNKKKLMSKTCDFVTYQTNLDKPQA